jgi:hypothetical protein
MRKGGVPDMETLMQAIARGWCHKANASKTMDPDLVGAIAGEVKLLLAAAPQPPATSTPTVTQPVANGGPDNGGSGTVVARAQIPGALDRDAVIEACAKVVEDGRLFSSSYEDAIEIAAAIRAMKDKP